MKYFAIALTFAAMVTTAANAFTVDVSMPNLTFPEPVETTQSCVSPIQLGTSVCPATE